LVTGFSRELRADRDISFSISRNASNQSLVVSPTRPADNSPPDNKSSSSNSGRGYRSKKKSIVVGNTTSSRPAGSSSPVRNTHFTRGQGGAIETDFYQHPTILSRMILFGKYASANQRCRDHPSEASVWVCSKRKARQVAPLSNIFKSPQQQQQQQQNQSSSFSLRQLPIHIACTALAFTHDNLLRTQLQQLIVRLVVTYPDGCSTVDHGGRLPLHEAIWSNASPETISMILMAAPESIEYHKTHPTGATAKSPVELNERRTGQHKAEIQDMLKLGVQYWDNARKEAKLRLKMAVIPASGASVTSTSVMNTSQADDETIMTADTANINAAPVPGKTKAKVEPFEPEEVTPLAWEQLERRVLLLERLLAEMYETNYDLAGVVKELKNTKATLAVELERAKKQLTTQRVAAAVALPHAMFPVKSSIEHTVKIVPEEDEMSSVKLLEQVERVDQLESFVGSYHSSLRTNTSGNNPPPSQRKRLGSKISELSSVSSPTEGVLVRNRHHMVRSDSLVSGLTADEATYFDVSIHAVKGAAWRISGRSLDTTSGEEKVENDSEDDTMAELHDSNREVSAVLGTDNLNEMFTKVAGRYGSTEKSIPGQSSRGIVKAWTSTPPPAQQSASPRKTTWTPPIAFPAQIQSDDTPKVGSRTGKSSPAPAGLIADLPMVWEPEDDVPSSSSSSLLPSTASSIDSTASVVEESKDSATPAPSVGQIISPAFHLEPEPSHVNSTFSISASLGTAMSENDSIVSTENDRVSLERNASPAPSFSEIVLGDEPTTATLSTKGRLERMVFGSRHTSPNVKASGDSTVDPSRYNFDIKIPALDGHQFATEKGEI